MVADVAGRSGDEDSLHPILPISSLNCAARSSLEACIDRARARSMQTSTESRCLYERFIVTQERVECADNPFEARLLPMSSE
jgi:hypothetical protein